jgi:outer membrane immunogenic protein
MRFSVALLLMTAGAHAADVPLPVKAPTGPPAVTHDWSGFYIGGIAGPSWALTTLAPAGAGMTAGGAFGGVDTGYRFQIGKLVFGADADMTFGNMRGNNATATFNIDRTATITGVGGIALDNWLFYGKGGAAWANPGYTSGGLSYLASENCILVAIIPSCTRTFGTATGAGADPRYGWTAGAGIEWAPFNSPFWKDWSVKVEYDHLELKPETTFTTYYQIPSATSTFTIRGVTTVAQIPAFTTTSTANDTTRADQVKVGLRWKFAPIPWPAVNWLLH